MKSKKLMLCMLIVIVFSFGVGTNNVYADELSTEVIENTDVDNDTEVVDNDTNIDVAEDSDIDEDLIEEYEVEEDASEENEESQEENKESLEVEEDEKSTKEDAKKEDTKKEDTKKSDSKTVAKETKKTATKKEENYTKAELRLLSSLIYAEAGNQSYKGKLAVANVVINRAKSNVFWHVDTIKEVIYDSKWGVQFSVIKKGSSGTSALSRALSKYDSKKYASDADKKSMEACIKAAKAALNGENNIGKYLYFNGYSKSLANRFPNHVIIGDHIFYSR